MPLLYLLACFTLVLCCSQRLKVRLTGCASSSSCVWLVQKVRENRILHWLQSVDQWLSLHMQCADNANTTNSTSRVSHVPLNTFLAGSAIEKKLIH